MEHRLIVIAWTTLVCGSAAYGLGGEVDVYFGCGCFWHVQHEFVMLEEQLLSRKGAEITSRTAYGGSKKTGPDGLVCYHNIAGVADYGSLGYTEVVSLSVPPGSFPDFAKKFWEVCPSGEREDWQDVGSEYRSAVGLPGGLESPYAKQLQVGAGSATLVSGKGGDDDTLGTHKVYVYDTAVFPAKVAEKYHQFHDDMVQAYGSAYNSLQRFAVATKCPGDGVVSVFGAATLGPTYVTLLLVACLIVGAVLVLFLCRRSTRGGSSDPLLLAR